MNLGQAKKATYFDLRSEVTLLRNNVYEQLGYLQSLQLKKLIFFWDKIDKILDYLDKSKECEWKMKKRTLQR